MRNKKIIDIPKEAKVYCKCFEDNFAALQLATTPKMRPRTKPVNILYHHLRENRYKRKSYRYIDQTSQSRSIHNISKETTVMVTVEIGINEGVWENINQQGSSYEVFACTSYPKMKRFDKCKTILKYTDDRIYCPNKGLRRFNNWMYTSYNTRYYWMRNSKSQMIIEGYPH